MTSTQYYYKIIQEIIMIYKRWFNIKNKIIVFIIIICVCLICFIGIQIKVNLKHVLQENKQDLMSLLDIKNSSSFYPISIKPVDLGLGDTTGCYELKFEISIDDYNDNSLNYKDGDTQEAVCRWK